AASPAGHAAGPDTRAAHITSRLPGSYRSGRPMPTGHRVQRSHGDTGGRHAVHAVHRVHAVQGVGEAHGGRQGGPRRAWRRAARAAAGPDRRPRAVGVTVGVTVTLTASYERCRRLHARHGRSYYLATRLLPAWKRRHVHALYGFARYA